MPFAVIKTGGKQYKVAANDVLKIEKLEAQTGDIVTFDQVLMVGDETGTTVGAPLVNGALVAAEFIDTKKQKTVIVFKKNRRHNYRRRNGHRQLLSTVRITEILTGGAQPTIASRPVSVAAQASDAIVTATEPDVEVTAQDQAGETPVAAKPARRARKATEAEQATPQAEQAPVDEGQPKPARRSAAKKAAPESEQE